jgi:hypothetical protein
LDGLFVPPPQCATEWAAEADRNNQAAPAGVPLISAAIFAEKRHRAGLPQCAALIIAFAPLSATQMLGRSFAGAGGLLFFALPKHRMN